MEILMELYLLITKHKVILGPYLYYLLHQNRFKLRIEIFLYVSDEYLVSLSNCLLDGFDILPFLLNDLEVEILEGVLYPVYCLALRIYTQSKSIGVVQYNSISH